MYSELFDYTYYDSKQKVHTTVAVLTGTSPDAVNVLASAHTKSTTAS